MVVQLVGVRVDNPGINYNCAEDTVFMKPDLGYKLEPVCGPFGRITGISLTPPPQIPFLETLKWWIFLDPKAKL